jgi:photosystem II stability/assembly factor-like uncharacterized protein
MNSKLIALPVVLGTAALAAAGALAQETTVVELAGRTHFHGIALDRADPERLLLATHHGLYEVRIDGAARRISRTADDLMGFAPHPGERDRFFSSGHPATGGNLGFLESRDGGRSWTRLADGVGGPVDFHQMAVSMADPNVITGVYRIVQRSADGGRTWRAVGPPPEGLIALAASAKDREVLYAATRQGVLRSADGGRSWTTTGAPHGTATAIHVTGDGTIYAFLAGTGMMRAAEPGADWRPAAIGLGGELVIHLVIDPADANRMAAVTYDPATRMQAVAVSDDGGLTWTTLGRDPPSGHQH